MQSGNIIDTVGIDVNKLDVFDVKNLEVNITGGILSAIGFNDYSAYYDVYASFLNGYSGYYDLECKIDFTSSNNGDLTVQWLPAGIIDNFSDYFDFVSGKSFRFFKNNSSFFCDIYFRVINKETGQVVHIKKIELSGSGTSFSVDNVINYDSQNSYDNNDGVSDYTGVNSSNSSLGGTSSNYHDVTWDEIKSQISTSGDFWQCISLILSCVPSWITGPIFFFISAVVTIVLTKMLVSAVASIMG